MFVLMKSHRAPRLFLPMRHSSDKLSADGLVVISLISKVFQIPVNSRSFHLGLEENFYSLAMKVWNGEGIAGITACQWTRS